MNRATYSLLLNISLHFIFHTDLISQTDSLIRNFPEHIQRINLDTTSIDDLTENGTYPISNIDTTKYGWVEWSIPKKEIVAASHLYDLNQKIRAVYLL